MIPPVPAGALAVAGILAAAALGSAAPRRPTPSAEHCDARLERLEAQFRQIEERRGYDEAASSGGRRLAGLPRALRRSEMAITDIDERKLEAFIGHAATELGAALNAALVTLGDELGLLQGDGRRPARLPRRARRAHRHPGALRARVAQRAGRERLRRSTTRSGGVRAAARARARARRRVEPVRDDRRVPGAERRVAVRERIAERFVDGDGVGWHEHHHGLFHGIERAFAAGYRDVPGGRVAAGARRRRRASSRRARSSPTSAAATARRRS